MAQTANAKIVILWDHQLTNAAKALHRVELARNDKGVSDDEIGRLMGHAYNACYAAIYSPELAAGVQVAILSSKRAVEEAEQAPPTSPPPSSPSPTPSPTQA